MGLNTVPGKTLAKTVIPAIAGEWKRCSTKSTRATVHICPPMRPSSAATITRGSPRTWSRLR